MKKYIILLFIFLSVPFLAIAQEDDSKKEEDTTEVKEKPIIKPRITALVPS